jgi:hypothetical protein
MSENTFTAALDVRIEALKVVLNHVADNGSTACVSDLRVLLLSVLGLVNRDPGLEQAADDVAAAATVVARSRVSGEAPDTRSLRLFTSFRDRLLSRLDSATGRGEGDDVRFRGLEAAYAVQLERDGGVAPPAPLVRATA